MTDNAEQQALFYQLILSFEAAAMQHLGQIENMMTHKTEKNMEQAKLSIDMIEMIKYKTEGNRTAEETQFLDQTLRELKMLFIKNQNKN